MADYVKCSDIDVPKTPIVPPADPASGGSLPAGGTTGQALVKASDADGDATWATIGGGGTPIVIDTALSNTSTNPVQNKVITQALNGKADSTALNALANTVAGKADQTAVDALQTVVNGKASQNDLDILSQTVAQKANQSDITALQTEISAKANKGEVEALASQLANKVDKETGKGLSANDFTDADKTKLDDLAGIKSIGSGLSLSASGELTATGGGGGDTKVFVAEYGQTTAQEILAYLNAANEPFAPIVIKRGDSYYTSVTAQKQADNKVILRSFATLSGDYYMFTYTVTDGTWAGANYGFQKKLVSGTDIKTINGESLLGSGDIDLATADDLATKQDVLTPGANISITTDAQTGVTTISATGTSITVDDALDEESTNPVQNRILYGIFESQRQVMQHMQDRIVVLEDKLKDFEEIRLQMSDGLNVVDKTILAKPYVLPITSMFDLRDGVYDANGTRLGNLTYHNYNEGTDPVGTEMIYWMDDGSGVKVEELFVDRILAAYPMAKGIVLWAFEFYNNSIKNAQPGGLDWLVAINDGGASGTTGRMPRSLVDGSVTDAIGTLYFDDFDMTNAPWGQTGSTINTTGVPLAWA